MSTFVSQLSNSLFWDVNPEEINDETNKRFIIQRVLERGTRNPWLESPLCEEGINLASIDDIAAMKVNAIINRGTKKDFIDMAFLLERYSLVQILNLYQRKYGVQDYQMALRSLTYFEDAELDVMPKMIINKDWTTVKTEITSQVKLLS